MKWGAYFRLMRFHKPVGILLLWFPTAWALSIADQNHSSYLLGVLFLLGTILMRAAGCVMNDMADRHIDLHVKRTSTRPLTTGEVSLIEAISLFLFLLSGACLILIQLPKVCFYYALLAVFITCLYPFCKRFIQGPQLILGIAFSLSIPMVFSAFNQAPNKVMICLLVINFLWVIAYDTQYAMADREDDIRIGVKSTAILFAYHDRFVIAFLQSCFHSLWFILAAELHYGRAFFYGWMIATLILLYQQKLIAQRESERCLQAFSSNSWYGLTMWLALLMG